ncbi:hypothetical protein LWI28_001173 [Acer negundo]|uniref:Uncharacterized protein n=1 Tax=Acer negundo TaxID=4023 RepID=A0AAD5JBV6_ACENE|nr:hypothetical protein LWI28_001173 [Acer negundo]
MSLLDGFSWKSLCVLPNQQPNNNPIQQPNILIQQPTINLRQQPNYNLIQQPNLEQKPIILTDSSSFSFEDDANYNSNGSSYQSTINSDDKVPNDASEDEIPNENDSVDENDGLSDVNKDDIADEEVVDQPIIGTAFRIGNDGRITLEVGKLFRNSIHFRKILLDYSIQEGFKLKRIKNEKRRITYRFKIDYLKDLFWPAVTSPNKVAFLQAMDEIKQTSPKAHAYLNGIPLET